MSDRYYSYTVYLKEHMLMAGEIATMFNIVSKSNKPAVNFVSAYLQEAVSLIPNYQQYYYTNRYGTNSKVYGKDVYEPAMTNLTKSLEKNILTKITVKDKNYIVKIGE